MSIEPLAMTEHDARRITERIRATAINARESLEKLQRLLTEARDGGAWSALGYKSWTAYLADVMGEQPLRLPRDQRQEIVGYLAGEGMSSRAIAPIVGASPSQVKRDKHVAHLGHVNTTNGEVADDYVTDQVDLDNPTKAEASGEVTPVQGATDSTERPTAEHETRPAPVKTTGLDGKQYTRPEPVKPKRAPLTDAFWKATYDLQKITERLERLHEDDRFERNKNEVAARNRNYLIQARECLDALIGDLPN